jgi:protease II
MRIKTKGLGAEHTISTVADREQLSEVVLDLAEVPFVQKHNIMNTVVNKLKMSDDHSRSAFILDIGNTERLTAGVKDMASNKVFPLKLENVS